MSDKNRFSQYVEKFIGGKGFYIVLFACIAVVGVSAWVLLFAEPAENPGGEDYVPVMGTGEDDGLSSDIEQVIKPPILDDEPQASNIEGNKVPVSNPVVTPEDNKGDTVPDEKPEDQPTQKPDEKPEIEPEAEPEEPKKTAEPLTFIWPVSGQVEVGHSPDALQYDKTMGDWRTHNGVDIAAQIGTKVMAAAAGTVSEVETDDMYGTRVYIDHGEGLISVYANLAAAPTVKKGDAVTMGSVIGSVGDTALAEKGEVAHLHFEMVKDGTPADPAEYLPRK